MSRATAIALLIALQLLFCQGSASTHFNPDIRIYSESKGGKSDKLDKLIVKLMKKHQINGLSLAVVREGKISKVEGYGFSDVGTLKQVTTETLFQAGSISKPVSALGVMYLVQQGIVSLDTDVNDYLKTWKVPESKLTRNNKVTLRRILSHSAGFNVHGFVGYDVESTIPELLDILDGEHPANSNSIKVKYPPGTQWQYSGGGYTVMQQLVIDITNQPFSQFLDSTVLQPFGMIHSTFAQPLPKESIADAASGYYQSGVKVKNGFHLYPEQAAAGLWTTPTDLAQMMIQLGAAFHGDINSVLSPKTVRIMLTEELNGDGLGFFVEKKVKSKLFSHRGSNAGFDSFFEGWTSGGCSIVVMINKNDDNNAILELVKAIRVTEFNE